MKEHPLARVGPGLITGVADDDPSGIATYSQAGAQFGLSMLWTMPLACLLMAAVQSMCGRIGRVTGLGLAADIKATFPPIVLRAVVLLPLVANTLNIAADVAAMGEVAELVSGFNRHLMTAFLVIGTLLLQMFVPLSLRAPPGTHCPRRWDGAGAWSGRQRTHADSTASSRSVCSPAW